MMLSLLKITNRDKLNVLKSLTNKSCLCCNTIICNDNWSPAITCCIIISEINENYKLIEKIILKIAFDKIKLLLNDDYKNKKIEKSQKGKKIDKKKKRKVGTKKNKGILAIYGGKTRRKY